MQPSPPSPVTARQQLVIDALAVGMPIARAASLTGVGRRTVHSWLADPAFVQALAERRRELAERVADRVAELGQVCLTTAIEYIGGNDANPGYGEPGRVKLAVELIREMGFLASTSHPKPKLE